MSTRGAISTLVFLVACAPPAARRAAPAALPIGEAWDYDVTVTPGAEELSVVARFPAGTPADLAVETGVEEFVRELSVVLGERWEPVAGAGGTWVVPSCRKEGCRIRYRFALARAALAIRDLDVASAHAGVFVAPPSTWLLRPVQLGAGRPFRLHVTTPPGVDFVTGMYPAPSEPNTFHADVGDLPIGPYSVFGRLQQSRITINAHTLEVAVAPGTFAVGQPAILEWIEGSARAAARYYRRFPVDRALLVLLPTEGDGFGYGKALGNGGASIVLPIGEKTSRGELADDWTLVHEILHLGFPSLAHEHIWLAEGIATYVEPIARARLGKLSPEAVWGGLVRGLPNGLPGPDDRGLDNTHTWGRTYWGGALFCLLADLEIRQRSQNRFSLDHALRAVLDQGGNIAVRWELARVLEVGDRASGLPVLRELHQQMGLQRYDVDLAHLWRRLGITVAGTKVTFDDGAPLAAIRRAITSAD